MTRTGARTTWLRLAFALAVIAVFVVQGIGGAIARSSQSPGLAHAAWCGSGSGQIPEGSSPSAHEQCCLPGGRHDAVGDAPALVATALALHTPEASAAGRKFGEPHPRHADDARQRPPVRGPPLR